MLVKTHSLTDIHTRVICFEHDQGLQCKLYRENNSGILQTPKCKSGRCNKPNTIQRWNYQINALYQRGVITAQQKTQVQYSKSTRKMIIKCYQKNEKQLSCKCIFKWNCYSMLIMLRYSAILSDQFRFITLQANRYKKTGLCSGI